MTVHYEDDMIQLRHGDALSEARDLETGSVQTIITSPPYYGLRDYGQDGQYGGEASVGAYVETMTALFRELRRALAGDGTLWLNLGDSYTGSWGAQGHSGQMDERRITKIRDGHVYQNPGTKTGSRREGEPPEKNLLGVPWRVALALQADGWYLRSDIIWHKPNPMPSSVTDRPTSSHEHLFLLSKSPRYYYDDKAIAETATGMSSGNGYARPEQIAKGGIGSDAQWDGRPQLRRALEIAREKGLTEEHFAAIRAVGMNDAGKAKAIQSGSGRNSLHVQGLADEAKTALGGYYREFLVGSTRNKRDVWTVPTVPFTEAHFATYPPELIRPCVLAGSRAGDTVLDPFSGSGTTGMVAQQEGRRYVGIDLSAEYLDLSLRTRFLQPTLGVEVAS